MPKGWILRSGKKPPTRRLTHRGLWTKKVDYGFYETLCVCSLEIHSSSRPEGKTSPASSNAR